MARLGVSRPIYVNVDTPNLGFTYFLGGAVKKSTLYHFVIGGGKRNRKEKLEGIKLRRQGPRERKKGKCSMCCVPVILCNVATVEGGVGAAFFVGLKRLIGPTGWEGEVM